MNYKLNILLLTGRIIELTGKYVTIACPKAIVKAVFKYEFRDMLKYGDLITVEGILTTSDVGKYPIIKQARIVKRTPDLEIYKKMIKFEAWRLRRRKEKTDHFILKQTTLLNSMLDNKFAYGSIKSKRAIKRRRNGKKRL